MYICVYVCTLFYIGMENSVFILYTIEVAVFIKYYTIYIYECEQK